MTSVPVPAAAAAATTTQTLDVQVPRARSGSMVAAQAAAGGSVAVQPQQQHRSPGIGAATSPPTPIAYGSLEGVVPAAQQQPQKSRIAGWTEPTPKKPPQQQQQQQQKKKEKPPQQQQQQQPKKEKGKGQQQQQQAKQQAKQQDAATALKTRDVNPLFGHLPQFEAFHGNLAQTHPSVARIGLGMAELAVLGSNARCVAMLEAFKDVFGDLVASPATGGSDAGMLRECEVAIKQTVQFLVDSRPISIGMGNAINFVKRHIGTCREEVVGTGEDNGPEAVCDYMCERIDEFISQRIVVADAEIVKMGSTKLVDGDVVLTYACSYIVEQIFRAAHDQGKRFRVVVVDSRPLCEGRELVSRLSSHGISCSYTLISGLSYCMQSVSKVFLGAHAMLSNGALLSRAGTALVAAVARSVRVPVIVCCESYKFSERAQLDSICYNQLGDPMALATHPAVQAYRNELLHPSATPSSSAAAAPAQPAGAPSTSAAATSATPAPLRMLNVMYDVTQIDFITMVLTEFGMIPPTSVPVIIREFRGDQVQAFTS